MTAITIVAFLLFLSHQLAAQILLARNGYSAAGAANNNFENVTRALDWRTIGQSAIEKLKSDNDTDWPSMDCILSWAYLAQSLYAKEEWALKVLDSYGRPEPGLLNGNLKWLGDFNECLNTSETTGNISIGFIDLEATFEPQYCMAKFSVSSAPFARVPGSEFLVQLMVGLCLPQNCPVHDQNGFVHSELKKLSSKSSPSINFIEITCPSRKTYLDKTAIAALVVLIVLLFLNTFGTIAYWKYGSEEDAKPNGQIVQNNYNHDDDSDFDEDEERIILPTATNNNQRFRWLTPIFACFSIKKNSQDLVEKAETFQIPALHGIRTISMFWIILGNTYLFAFALTANPLEFLDPTRHGFFFQIILQAVLAIDGFFVLSGFLTALHFFRRSQPDKSVFSHMAKTFALRLLRLLPTYGLLLLFYIGLWKYVAVGPLWKEDGFEIDQCRSTWWTNMVFLNNFVDYFYEAVDGNLHRQYCMEWTWSMAVEMQLFLLSPIILVPLYKSSMSSHSGPSNVIWRWASILTVAISSIACIVATAIVHTTYDMPPNLFPPNLTLAPKAESLASFVYYRPYAHAPCYTIGLLLGYYIATKNGSISIPKNISWLCWLLSTACAGMSLFTIWPEYQGHTYSPAMSTIYDGFSRLGWAISVGWLIFACATKNSNFANRFLSLSIWRPLSRVTYSTFLVHPMLMVAYYYSRKDAIYYTDGTLVWFFGSFLLYGYICGALVYLLFEAPILAIKKLITK